MVKDYIVYGTIMYSGEESVFSITAESKAEVLRLCEDDFGSNFRVDYIVAATEENSNV